MLNKQNIIRCATVMLLTAGLLAACSTDDDIIDNGGGGATEIRLNADCWRVMEATRAVTYDSDAQLQASRFACYAYEDGTTTQYISGSTVSYSDSQWTFDDGKHYWPASGALNFFAYMPANLSGTYCTFDPTAYDASDNADGYSDDSPRIVCTDLPVSFTVGSDNTQEPIFAYTADQDKFGTNSTLQPTPGYVGLTFKHPFARVCFKLSEASGTHVTVNSVTVSGIKNNGTCTFDGSTITWIPTGDATNLVISGTPATGDDCYLVIPQTFASNITFTVNATWTDWSNVTKNVSASVNVGSWVAGYSYTYTLTLDKFALTVDAEKFTEQW
jgi:hypothetical protein